MANVIVVDIGTGVAETAPASPAELAEIEERKAAWAAGQAERDRQALAERRYKAEISGCVFNGWPVPTDRESQSKISAAYSLARDGHWPTGAGWKFADGTYRVMSAEQIITMALAVSAHVQACFAHEAALQANPGSDINVGWPAGI